MADIKSEIVLESANKQIRYKLLVMDDGKLAAVRLFEDPDGNWKPKGDYAVLATIDANGKVGRGS